MISNEDRQLLCALIDDLRLRGVHIVHLETGSVKVEIHVNPLSAGELPLAKESQESMLEKANLTPEQKATLEQQQADRDLFSDTDENDDDK